MSIYVALKAVGKFTEYAALHVPVDGWVWVRCDDLGALLRDIARQLAAGEETGHLVTASGKAVDPLEAERYMSELENPVLEGCVDVLACDPVKLLELGAVYARVKPDSEVIHACFKKISIERLISCGCIPAVWRGVFRTPKDENRFQFRKAAKTPR